MLSGICDNKIALAISCRNDSVIYGEIRVREISIANCGALIDVIQESGRCGIHGIKQEEIFQVLCHRPLPITHGCQARSGIV